MAAPKKRASKGSPAVVSPRVVPPVGEPVGHFARVLAEARSAGLAIEPFEITADLVLQPPSQARLKQMDEASAAYLLAQTVAANLIGTQGDPPQDPEERQRWATTQQAALRNATDTANEAEQRFNEALYGGPDVLQRVEEFFADRPGWEKQAFASAVNQQFRRLPKDGKCVACQRVVDAQAGESVGGSSGTLSTSGTSSTPISPPNTEPTSMTGSEEPVHGPSSSTGLSA